jgi:AraC family transcriptional regulator of adaptative response / DNA-3-methyladenine glycosylase II
MAAAAGSKSVHLAQRNALQLRFAAPLAAASQQLLARTRQVFDLGADPAEIASVLGTLAAGAEGLRLPGAYDAFELATRAILGQQVTVKAARTLATRFVDAFGEAVATPFEGLTRIFPTSGTGGGLRRATTSHPWASSASVPRRSSPWRGQSTAANCRWTTPRIAERMIDALCRIRGIGPWTAHYIAMRALAWPDAWPPKDVAILKALGLPVTARGQREADALAEAWRPGAATPSCMHGAGWSRPTIRRMCGDDLLSIA